MWEKSRWTPELIDVEKSDCYYALTMFPYPSGYGLHAWHASVFTINDIIARYNRMKWKTVLNPIGFDSFGLPTENYAMKLWKPAYEVTKENIQTFLKQMDALQLSFDQDRIFATSDAEYYKWTQRIFQELFKAWLVYRDELWVNRCPDCQTVLANDQVVEGHCERCKAAIIQKKMPQWFIKITDYADRLIEDLDLIDRPEETKAAQRNWIGRSEWLLFTSPVKWEDYSIQTFSSHFEACHADTFVVIAPEHDMLPKLLEWVENKDEILAFCDDILQKRIDAWYEWYKEIEWIFTWKYIVDPLWNWDLPIWVASFALAWYGTGMVKCSAHDERDFEFAKKYNIPLKTVLMPFDEELKEKVLNQEVCFSDMSEWYLTEPKHLSGKKWKEVREAIVARCEKNKWAETKVNYKLRDRSVSRQRYWGSPIPVYYDNEWNPQLIPQDQLPVELPLDVENYKPKGKSPLEEHDTFATYTHTDWNVYKRECDTLDTFMCSSFYFLRFPDRHNDKELISKEIADKMLPVDMYSWGKEHTVGHLLYSRFIHKFLYDQGYVSSKEPFKKLIHQWMIMGADGRKMSKRRWNVIDPLDVIEQYGSDAVRTYIMFMWPVEQDKVWNDSALKWMKKFLDRVARLIPDDSELSNWTWTDEANKVISVYHETIKWMTYDLEHLKLNTAVSKIMILVNTIYEHRVAPLEVLTGLALFLAPFAPTLADTLWKSLGNDDDVAFAARPVADESKIAQATINLPVQINGKMRWNIDIAPGTDEATVLEMANSIENIAKYIDGQPLKKVIYVQDRILNIIV